MKNSKAQYIVDIVENLSKFNTYRENSTMLNNLKESLFKMNIEGLSYLQAVAMGLDCSSFEERDRPIIFNQGVCSQNIWTSAINGTITEHRQLIQGMVNISDYLLDDWDNGDYSSCKRLVNAMKEVCNQLEKEMKKQLYDELIEG